MIFSSLEDEKIFTIFFENIEDDFARMKTLTA